MSFAVSWTGPLSPRPFLAGYSASEAAQGWIRILISS